MPKRRGRTRRRRRRIASGRSKRRLQGGARTRAERYKPPPHKVTGGAGAIPRGNTISDIWGARVSPRKKRRSSKRRRK